MSLSDEPQRAVLLERVPDDAHCVRGLGCTLSPGTGVLAVKVGSGGYSVWHRNCDPSELLDRTDRAPRKLTVAESSLAPCAVTVHHNFSSSSLLRRMRPQEQVVSIGRKERVPDADRHALNWFCQTKIGAASLTSHTTEITEKLTICEVN